MCKRGTALLSLTRTCFQVLVLIVHVISEGMLFGIIHKLVLVMFVGNAPCGWKQGKTASDLEHEPLFMFSKDLQCVQCVRDCFIPSYIIFMFSNHLHDMRKAVIYCQQNMSQCLQAFPYLQEANESMPAWTFLSRRCFGVMKCHSAERLMHRRWQGNLRRSACVESGVSWGMFEGLKSSGIQPLNSVLHVVHGMGNSEYYWQITTSLNAFTFVWWGNIVMCGQSIPIPCVTYKSGRRVQKNSCGRIMSGLAPSAKALYIAGTDLVTFWKSQNLLLHRFLAT